MVHDRPEYPRLEAHGPVEDRLLRPTRLNALGDGIFAIQAATHRVATRRPAG